MRILLTLFVAMMLFMPTASATSSFGYSQDGLIVQFVGREFSPDFNGLIELSDESGPRTVSPDTYTLTNYSYRKSLRLTFVNPGDESLPPSFTLNVSGDEATVDSEGEVIVGQFSWDS